MKVLIACGGTGGHVFPGISLYNSLKRIYKVADILLVSDKRVNLAQFVQEDFQHIYISIVPLRFKFSLQNAIAVLKLFQGTIKSLKIILRFRPDVVVGFGGYASFPLVFFACILGCRAVIHEQNVVPGKANKVLAYLVDKIAISFDKTRDYFSLNSCKLRFTGNPLRSNLTRIEKNQARKFLGLYPDKFTILVMGGSQGSHKINTIFIKAVGLFDDKRQFQIIHLCGDKDRQILVQDYKELGIEAKIFTFFSSMEYVYSAADIVVSRAGATTINEIAFFRLPAIFIPYPYAGGHQLRNINYLCENEAAIMIEENDFSPEVLGNKILELFHRLDSQKLISKNISKFSNPKADEYLANLVLNG